MSYIVDINHKDGLITTDMEADSIASLRIEAENMDMGIQSQEVEAILHQLIGHLLIQAREVMQPETLVQLIHLPIEIHHLPDTLLLCQPLLRWDVKLHLLHPEEDFHPLTHPRKWEELCPTHPHLQKVTNLSDHTTRLHLTTGKHEATKEVHLQDEVFPTK